MSTSLQTFHYHVVEDPESDPDETARSPESFRGRVPGGLEADAPPQSFTSAEAAARYLPRPTSATRRPRGNAVARRT